MNVSRYANRMLIAAIVFFISLGALFGLFGLKYWELSHGRILFPNIRTKADMRARVLKELMIAARLDLSNVSPTFMRLVRFFLHRFALAFASFARLAEQQSHRLADMVSYKHRFEKRETRSEFLKKVSEHKNGNGLDVGGDNGHNSQTPR